jgi:hypothetical protein
MGAYTLVSYPPPTWPKCTEGGSWGSQCEEIDIQCGTTFHYIFPGCIGACSSKGYFYACRAVVSDSWPCGW